MVPDWLQFEEAELPLLDDAGSCSRVQNLSEHFPDCQVRNTSGELGVDRFDQTLDEFKMAATPKPNPLQLRT